MSSTFDGLYIAKSGVQAARTNLNTTGQNIANANTAGYTRQRVDQSSVAPTSINMLYAGTGAIVGEGVTTTGISQLRNKFLDGQYRTQNAQSGLTSTQLSALQDIEDALNETSTDGISAAYSALVKQLEGLTSSGSSTATESTVKEAASLLATKLNTAANQLETIRNQQYNYLDQYGVDKVNTLLKNISSLSDQIKSADLAGSPALELLDERNSMIDELSQYVNVKVVETPTDVGAGKSVDTLSIYLADSKGDALSGSYPLVDGNQYSELGVTGSAESAGLTVSGLTKDGVNFSVESGAIATDSDGKLTSDIDSTYDFTLGNGTAVSINITASAGDTMEDLLANAQTALNDASLNVTVGLSSDGTRLTFTPTDGSELSVTDSGSDPLGLSHSSLDRGIGNDDFQGGSLSGYLSLLNDNGEYDKTSADDTTNNSRGIGYYENMLDTLAQQLASVMNADNSTNDTGDNKPIFTDSAGNTVDASGNSTITAANIRVSPKWDDPQYSEGYLTLSKDTSNSGDDSSGSNSNITQMITDLTTSKYTLSTPNGVSLFTGTMQEAVDNVSLTLGQDIDAVDAQDTANSTMLNNIDTRRQAQSSVDINEEAINLIVYNQALSASARFMTTVDECLDTLINNMGIVGRG
ncbi:flagellar hook-associated protein FlgK [Caproiciproducens sp. NJN-50]|uniref:flagellar hook-associated protein FlgK n=1 Tax=Acutalibacteraceae TaxID=3082771 RepID=UPI000FFE1CDF|nr:MULTISPECIES: flagellar hook-associated protein FlgK [Acutalibacteraceae]QAT50699.1 flagellar hook-associated protein FlgK [Caproiciproducens sp. NJN-50]